MKKQDQKKTKLWQRIGQALAKVGRRFPETLVLVVIFVVTMIILVASDSYYYLGIFSGAINILGGRGELGFGDETWLFVVNLIQLFVSWGVLISLNYRLYSETDSFRAKLQAQKKEVLSGKKLVGRTIVVTLIGIGLMYGLTSVPMRIVVDLLNESQLLWFNFWQQSLMWWRLGLELILIVGVVYFLLKKQTANNLYQLIIYLVQQVILAMIFGGAVFVGLLLATGLIDFLFIVDLWEWHKYTAILIWIGFVSVFLLSTLPKNKQSLEEFKIAKIWQVLLTYIAGPLIAIYSIILDLYLVQQLIRWEWPEGGVVNLILWFAMGVLVWSVLTGFWRVILKEDKKRKRIQWWWRILAINVWILMVVAIVALGLRVGEHGWTANRWLVLTGILWVGGGMIWLWQKRVDRQARIVEWTMILVLMGVIGAPIATYFSQQSKWGDEWLEKMEEGGRRDFIFDESSGREEIEMQKSFYFSDQEVTEFWRKGMSLQNVDVLLMTNEEEANEVEWVNENGEQQSLTYRWLKDDTWLMSGEDDDGIATYDELGQIGELIVWQNGEEKLRIGMKDWVDEINAVCQTKKEATDNSSYNYGCASYLGVEEGGVDPEQLKKEWEGDGWRLTIYLQSWEGEIDLATNKSVLGAIDGMALISWEE